MVAAGGVYVIVLPRPNHSSKVRELGLAVKIGLLVMVATVVVYVILLPHPNHSPKEGELGLAL